MRKKVGLSRSLVHSSSVDAQLEISKLTNMPAQACAWQGPEKHHGRWTR